MNPWSKQQFQPSQVQPPSIEELAVQLYVAQVASNSEDSLQHLAHRSFEAAIVFLTTLNTRREAERKKSFGVPIDEPVDGA